MTWHDPDANVYALIVKDYDMHRSYHLTKSGSHVSLYGRGKGEVAKLEVPTEEPGSRKAR